MIFGKRRSTNIPRYPANMLVRDKDITECGELDFVQYWSAKPFIVEVTEGGETTTYANDLEGGWPTIAMTVEANAMVVVRHVEPRPWWKLW